MVVLFQQGGSVYFPTPKQYQILTDINVDKMLMFFPIFYLLDLLLNKSECCKLYMYVNLSL